MKKIVLLFLCAPLFVYAQFDGCALFENTLTDPNPVFRGYFGKHMIADGNDLAVLSRGTFSEASTINMYEYLDNELTHIQTIDMLEVFGQFVDVHIDRQPSWALSNGTLAMTVNTFSSGNNIVIFEKENGSWELQQTILSPTGGSMWYGDSFGISIALSDGWLMINESGHNFGCSDCVAGRIRMYTKAQNEWTLQEDLLSHVPNLIISDDFAPFIPGNLTIQRIRARDGKLVIEHSFSNLSDENIIRHYIYTIHSLSENNSWDFEKIFWFEKGGYSYLEEFDITEEDFIINVGFSGSTFTTNQKITTIPLSSISFQGGYSSFSAEIIECPDQEEYSSFGQFFAIHPSNPNIIITGDGFYDHEVDPYPWNDIENCGKLYVFQKSNGDWNLTEEILPMDPDNQSRLGEGVAILSNTIFGGAPGTNHEITESGMIYMFSCQSMTVSQDEIENTLTITTLYPNPASDVLHISGLIPNEIYTLRLYTSTGLLAYETRVNGQNVETLDLRAYTSGVYILDISSDIYRVNECFIKR